MTKHKIKPKEEIDTNTITDIKIDKIFPNTIDKIMVTIIDSHHTLFIPMNINGQHFRNWKKGRGGIFSKDVLNYSLDKPHGKYIIIKSKTLNCIARLIDEEEKIEFKSLKLIDGVLKDRSYMILTNIESDSKITNITKYMNEKDLIHDIITFPLLNYIKPEEDVEHEHPIGSISLFSE
jgi:hypothetical protein